MTTTSRLRRWQGNLRRLPGRTPLRVKMITALLALVIIALAVISVASLTVFRNYQIQPGQPAGHGAVPARSACRHPRRARREPQRDRVRPLPDRHRAERHLTGAAGRATSPACRAGPPLPDVPTSGTWYKAHGGHLINVGAVSGSDNWQVVAQQFPVGPRTSSASPRSSNATLIVGVDLGDINGTISQLAAIDLIVSVIIIVGLAVVGVAVVRASLRPLTDIEQTARAIAAGDLSRRVPDQDPRTEVGQLGRSLNTMLAQIEIVLRRPDPVRGGRAALRGADAPVRGGRQPRAAHPADRDARLRRVLPPAGRPAGRAGRDRGRGHRRRDRQRPTASNELGSDELRQRRPAHPGRHGPDHAAGRAGVGPDGRAGRGHAAAGPAGPAAAASSTGRWTCSRWPPTRCRTPGSSRPDREHHPRRRVRRRVPGPRRRGAAAPGHRQPDEQRADPHPGRAPRSPSGCWPGRASRCPASCSRSPTRARACGRTRRSTCSSGSTAPTRPGPGGRRHRPRPGHRGRAGGGARRHRRAEDRAGPGRHVPDHAAAGPRGPRRPPGRG